MRLHLAITAWAVKRSPITIVVVKGLCLGNLGDDGAFLCCHLLLNLKMRLVCSSWGYSVVHLLVEAEDGDVKHRRRAAICTMMSHLLLSYHELLLKLLLFEQPLRGAGWTGILTCGLLLMFLDHEAFALASVVLRWADCHLSRESFGCLAIYDTGEGRLRSYWSGDDSNLALLIDANTLMMVILRGCQQVHTEPLVMWYRCLRRSIILLLLLLLLNASWFSWGQIFHD